jgi:hypothetical protein
MLHTTGAPLQLLYLKRQKQMFIKNIMGLLNSILIKIGIGFISDLFSSSPRSKSLGESTLKRQANSGMADSLIPVL